jgi:predicted nucleic acid-binding protein
MKYLLDTSALLAHARGEPEARMVQELFDTDDAEILLCSVSLAEMARRFRELGVPEDKNQKLLLDYEDLAGEMVPVTAEVARKAGQLTLRAGKRLPLVDALIAATASLGGAVLVHRDAHMRSIPRGDLNQLDLANDG